MKTSDCEILILPGPHAAEPDHWHARWARQISSARALPWGSGDGVHDPRALAPHAERLVEEVAQAEKPVVLVAHDGGALVVLAAAPALTRGVAGAMLVAPHDPSDLIETAPLPFPTLLVASRDDPIVPFERAEGIAREIGATLVDAGASGHIDSQSGFGPWPEGLMRFAGFLKKL